MRFAYPEMTTTQVKGLRLYETPTGQFYPSITTMLGETQPAEKREALRKWQLSLGLEQANRKTREAADRGTAVHLLIERYLKKEQLIQSDEKFKPEDVSLFNALKLKLNSIKEVWGQEVALYSTELELAGRCDCIGVYKNKPCIIDFKTSGRIKGSDQIEDYRLQLCAYAIMHNEMFNTDIHDGIILMASDSGFPQEFAVKLDDYVEPLKKRIKEFYTKLSTTL